MMLGVVIGVAIGEISLALVIAFLIGRRER